MILGLRFQIVWSDNDGIQVRVLGTNGLFAGRIDAYVEPGGLTQFAKDLSGFPRDADDKREVILGRFGPEWAGGAVRLRFRCTDAAGHCAFDAKFESDGNRLADGCFVETACFQVRFEAAALDRMIHDLAHLESMPKGSVADLHVGEEDQDGSWEG